MRSEVEAAGPGPSPSILSLHRGLHRAGSSDTSSLALAQEEQQGRTLEQFGVPLPVVNPSVWQVPVIRGTSILKIERLKPTYFLVPHFPMIFVAALARLCLCLCLCMCMSVSVRVYR